jgi:hypothetical protein
MSKGPWPVSQSAVRRLVRGAESAGIKVARIEYENGKLVIIPGTASDDVPTQPTNEWDNAE